MGVSLVCRVICALLIVSRCCGHIACQLQRCALAPLGDGCSKDWRWTAHAVTTEERPNATLALQIAKTVMPDAGLADV